MRKADLAVDVTGSSPGSGSEHGSLGLLNTEDQSWG